MADRAPSSRPPKPASAPPASAALRASAAQRASVALRGAGHRSAASQRPLSSSLEISFMNSPIGLLEIIVCGDKLFQISVAESMAEIKSANKLPRRRGGLKSAEKPSALARSLASDLSKFFMEKNVDIQ